MSCETKEREKNQDEEDDRGGTPFNQRRNQQNTLQATMLQKKSRFPQAFGATPDSQAMIVGESKNAPPCVFRPNYCKSNSYLSAMH